MTRFALRIFLTEIKCLTSFQAYCTLYLQMLTEIRCTVFTTCTQICHHKAKTTFQVHCKVYISLGNDFHIVHSNKRSSFGLVWFGQWVWEVLLNNIHPVLYYLGTSWNRGEKTHESCSRYSSLIQSYSWLCHTSPWTDLCGSSWFFLTPGKFLVL